MAIVEQQVSICQEVDSLLQVVVGVVSDAKAGKAPAQIVQDAMPMLITALSGLSQLSSEVNVANSEAVDITLALKMVQLKEVLLPGAI